jgi:transcriptional regulator with XRE-family HTH domain
MKLRSPISEAVLAIRLATNDTQQQFAQRMCLAISTVVRYEITRPPKGAALNRFFQLAEELHRPDLIRALATAILLESGVNLSGDCPICLSKT